ncbi:MULTISPECIES: hypothetical protein [unclassified Sinorhizobium]|uniref:hypothetical protein n=1 Tax=unclassified Sinorhizobium TaxID=2613772 RepID=UPI0035253AEE
MKRWQDIATAPKDGSVVQVKRVYDGRVVYEGPAVWRTVHFRALHDPLTGKEYAEAYDGTGWMYHDKDFRVPEPTHWRPV